MNIGYTRPVGTVKRYMLHTVKSNAVFRISNEKD